MYTYFIFKCFHQFFIALYPKDYYIYITLLEFNKINYYNRLHLNRKMNRVQQKLRFTSTPLASLKT